jgi:hypothetical protein
MGYGELRRLDAGFSVEQEVQVKGPLSPADEPQPPEPVLDAAEMSKQLMGPEGGLHRGRRVEERVLIAGAPDGRRLVI